MMRQTFATSIDIWFMGMSAFVPAFGVGRVCVVQGESATTVVVDIHCVSLRHVLPGS
jgi:hypothetical protein